jgi:hypothetical protein
MKETIEKQAVNYAEGLTLPELLALAMAGDREAAGEIIRRQDAQKAEIEQLKIKAAGKRTPKAEKTPFDLARDNAYFRCALLVKQFGAESVDLQTLTAASAYLECGLAQGNLRQAFNRVTQILKAQAVNESVFPEWILTAASEIPQLDENKKLEEEEEKVAEIKATIQKYMEAPEPAATPAAATPAKKASKK